MRGCGQAEAVALMELASPGCEMPDVDIGIMPGLHRQHGSPSSCSASPMVAMHDWTRSKCAASIPARLSAHHGPSRPGTARRSNCSLPRRKRDLHASFVAAIVCSTCAVRAQFRDSYRTSFWGHHRYGTRGRHRERRERCPHWVSTLGSTDTPLQTQRMGGAEPHAS